MKNMNRFVIVGILLSLTACKHWWGGDDEEDNPFQGVTATQLYADSKKAMAKEEYSAAIKRLEALDTMYPFNDYAEQAQIDLIYAYYKKKIMPLPQQRLNGLFTCILGPSGLIMRIT